MKEKNFFKKGAIQIPVIIMIVTVSVIALPFFIKKLTSEPNIVGPKAQTITPTVTPTPTQASTARTCRIEMFTSTSFPAEWGSNGKWRGIRVFGKGETVGSETVRLWAERKDGLPMVDSRINTYIGGSYIAVTEPLVLDGKTYYKLSQCNSVNKAECTFSLEAFFRAEGEYSLHCDVISAEQTGCSGNPFCIYEGGTINCGNFVSCSDNDNFEFSLGAVPTVTPSITVTPTQTPTVTVTPTVTPTSTVTLTPTPTASPCACAVGVPPKNLGNANCDNFIDGQDFEIWRQEIRGLKTTTTADFNCADGVTEADYEIWKRGRWVTALMKKFAAEENVSINDVIINSLEEKSWTNTCMECQ